VIVRGKNKQSDEFSFGEIEIPKDSADILKKSLLNPINDAAARMTKGKVCAGPDPDGQICVHKKGSNSSGDDSESGCCCAVFDEARAHETDALALRIDFRIFLTGDIEFYAMCLGKENSDTKWCWHCTLAWAEWQKEQNESGDHWTIEKIKEHAGTLSSSSAPRVKGACDPDAPLLKLIAPDRHICPLLHAPMGIGNDMLKLFLSFVDKRRGLEALPDSLVKAHVEADQLKLELQNLEAIVDKWLTQHHQAQLAKLRQDKEQCRRLKQQRGLAPESKEIFRQCWEDAGNSVKELEKQKAVIVDLQKKAIDKPKAKTIEVEAEEKAHPKALRQTLGEVEMILKKHGIDKAAWHGGDLVYVAVKRFMEFSDLTFSDIKTHLRNRMAAENVEEEQVTEAEDFCSAVKECLVLFDGLFSALSKTQEDVEQNPDSIVLAERHMTAALHSLHKLRKNRTPKAHGSIHGVGQMRICNGISDHVEQFVERLHQEGVRALRRVKTLRDRTQKHKAMAENEHARRNPAVQEIVDAVFERRSQSKKRVSSNSGEQIAKRRRETREDNRLSALLNFESKDPSTHRIWNLAEELNLRDQKQPQEEATQSQLQSQTQNQTQNKRSN